MTKAWRERSCGARKDGQQLYLLILHAIDQMETDMKIPVDPIYNKLFALWAFEEVGLSELCKRMCYI